MNSQEYYQRVIDRLKNCFQFSHYVIAAGHELVAEGYDPAFPAAAEPIHRLENFTLQRGFQLHIPIVGERSQSVLMPIDFEIFLAEENHKLYEDPVAQKNFFDQTVPVIQFLDNRRIWHLRVRADRGCHASGNSPILSSAFKTSVKNASPSPGDS
ncbi:MAG: hypothetical protein PVI42_07660 [Desulfobacterales bacterium]|jgi:hypothetical protein